MEFIHAQPACLAPQEVTRAKDRGEWALLAACGSQGAFVGTTAPAMALLRHGPVAVGQRWKAPG
jgi:hypothetical protein